MANWSEADIAMLRHLAAEDATVTDAADYLQRTIKSVRAKCTELNIPLKKMYRVFSDDDVVHLRDLVADGKSGVEIAQIMNRPPLSVRAKCCSLGLLIRRPRPPSPPSNRVRVDLDPAIKAKLEIAAEARGITVCKLVRQLLTTAAWHELIDAVLDDEKQRRAVRESRKRTAARQKTKSASKSAEPETVLQV